ncbi:MAG TPA: hypothetical protein VJ914_11055 [Pseudonocardiaceae bacterium]|nr:hypothetical protein [Pseudonocardiaceae bacterium]
MSAESIPQYRELRCKNCMQTSRVSPDVSKGSNWICTKCGAINDKTRQPGAPRPNIGKVKVTRGDVAAIVGGVGGGVLLLIIGIALHAAFDTKAALCNSGFGVLGQEMAGASARAECAGWNFGDGVAGILTWIGGLLLAGTVLLGIVFAVAKRQQG